MSDAFLGLEWDRPSTPHIRLTVVLMHGRAELFNEVPLTFSDSPGGHEHARTAMAALPHLSKAVRDNPEGTLEDTCTFAAKKLGGPLPLLTGILTSMFESVIVFDSTGGDLCAQLVAYTVEYHTELGGVRRALFPASRGRGLKCHYKALSDIHPSNLKQWA
jgi:hypothetical protein